MQAPPRSRLPQTARNDLAQRVLECVAFQRTHTNTLAGESSAV